MKMYIYRIQKKKKKNLQKPLRVHSAQFRHVKNELPNYSRLVMNDQFTAMVRSRRTTIHQKKGQNLCRALLHCQQAVVNI